MERSKGWYDHDTGQVVIVMGKHDNVEDVEHTMLHEIVAHHGIDDILGGAAEADALYDEKYDHLKDPERQRVNEKMNSAGYDRAKATHVFFGGPFKISAGDKFE